MERVRIPLLLFVVFCIIPSVAIAEQSKPLIEEQGSVGLSWEYQRNGGEPRGFIYTNAPKVSYYIKLTDIRNHSYDLKMFINGEEVPAEYSASTHDLTYHAHNLTGKNEVNIRLYLSGQLTFEKGWSFTIDENPVLPLEVNTEYMEEIQYGALEAANQYRELLGLTLFTSNPQLQQAAQAHANYLFDYPDDGHLENQTSSQWFTGYKTGDRTGYYGYTGFIGEGITFQEPAGEVAITHLFDAPYHRMSLIDPRFTTMGTGYNQSGDFVANYGGRGEVDQSKVITYPIHGQSNVKVSWFAYESPNPLRFFNENHIWTGYPISYKYFGAKEDKLKVTHAGLYLKDGTEVPVYKVLPSMDDHGTHHVFLIPKEKLLPGKEYQAVVEAEVEGSNGSTEDFSKSWSFMTADQIEVEKVYFERQQNTTFLKLEWLSGTDPNATITLSKDGKEYIKKKGNNQYSYHDLEEGTYTMNIDSPWFDEKKNYVVTLVRNTTRHYTHSGELSVESFYPLPTEPYGWKDYPEWMQVNKVPSNKKWTITFNQQMELPVNDPSIYVVNDQHGIVPVQVIKGEKEQTFEVLPPEPGYKPGSYQLVVEPLTSLQGVPMNDGIRMEFWVE